MKKVITAALWALFPVPGAFAQPAISITNVPSYGTLNGTIYGTVSGVSPATHKVAVVIFIDGNAWFNKPSYVQKYVLIDTMSSTWHCLVTTGGQDELATRYGAYLVPDSQLSSIPTINAAGCIDNGLDSISVAKTCVERTPRTIDFCGYTWWVKKAVLPAGPDNNYFSDSPSNVWVDSLCRLHLKIDSMNGHWYCPEVYLRDMNYPDTGRFIFRVETPVGNLDPNAVLGLFTWDQGVCPGHKELDIEFSANLAGPAYNAQYVFQPLQPSPNYIAGWTMPANIDSSTHIIEWKNNTARFSSYRGLWCGTPPATDSIHTWQFSQPIDAPTPQNIRINLWLVNGIRPTNGQPVEVVISQCGCTIPCGSAGIPATVQDEKCRIFPNPSTGTFTLEASVNGPLIVTIYDIHGSLVQVQTTHSPKSDFSLLSYPKGLYIIKVQRRGGQTEVVKLMYL